MSYFYLFGGQQHLQCYYSGHLPFYSTFPFVTNTVPFHNTTPTLSAEGLPPNQAQKSARQVATFVSEEPMQNLEEAVRNRRKRQRNLDREVVSAKKNSQSNIINHFFTHFVLRDTSETVVRRAIKSLNKSETQTEKIMTILYNTIRVINLKRGRKYINKVILCGYFTQEWLLSEIQNIEQQLFVSAAEIALVLRKCLYNFINEVSFTSVLTSKRITTHSKRIHLEKRRKILNYMQCKCDQ